MQIYIDILFFITSEIMSAALKPLRALSAAAAGAAAGVCFFIFDFKLAPLFSAVCAAAMTAAAFCPCPPKELIKLTLCFYLSAAVSCGVIYADMRLFGGGMIKNGIFYASSPRITLTAAAVWLAARLYSQKMKRRASEKFSSVIFEYNGRRAEYRGFVDTGNGLVDPISGRAVMLVEDCVLKELVSDKCTAENLPEWADSVRLRIIPYTGVSGEGYFNALVLDRAYIDGKCIERAIIAACSKKLKYPVILHAGM